MFLIRRRMACVPLLLALFPGGLAGSEARFLQAEEVGLRQIVLASEAEAQEVRDQALGGRPFELLAREYSRDSLSSAAGGYLGRVVLADLRTEFQRALAGVSPGGISPPIRIGESYVLLQMVTEAEMEWIELDEAGAGALADGRDLEAAGYFEAALETAETLSGGDATVARSLDSLATVYRMLDQAGEAEPLYRRALALLERLDASELETAQVLNGLGMALAAQGRGTEAEPVYREALAIRERVLGADDPEVAGVLQNLAELAASEDRFSEAAELYERSVSLLEAGLGPSHPATLAGASGLARFRRELVPKLLDRLSSIVALAEFRDRGFDQYVSDLMELLPLAPLSELSYVQMKDVLLRVSLTEVTEQVLLLGLERFPDSRILRIYLADLQAGTGRTQDALELLEEASSLPRPEGLDVETDRQQRGIIFQRIGDVELALTHLEDAVTAYRRSLEIDPASPGGRLKLGRAYVRNNRLEEAIAEYLEGISETPDDAELHLDLSEAYLANGQWEQAVAAAQRAIDLGTSDSRALYVLGTAEVRMGDREPGQEHLREFAEVSAGFSEAEHENREVDALNLDAIEAFGRGESQTAVDSLRSGIEKFPDADGLRMNLAMVLSRRGQHEAAVEVLEQMLDLGVGRGFLIHKLLADEYGALGDSEASQSHHRIYMETREAELIVYGPE